MKHTLIALALGLQATTAFAEGSVGYLSQSITMPHHGRAAEAAAFYPGDGGDVVQLGENGVFHGADVSEGAEIAPGKYPIILLSHGWGGNTKRMAWLSRALAAKGAIVLAINHPNSSTGETGSMDALNHWTRAQDLSALLDWALKDSAFAAHADTSRVYALGFSYGGWTALQLGGLRGRRAGLEGFCKTGQQISSHCRDILRAGINIAAIPEDRWNASYKDARVAAVAAIDPALTQGLTKQDTMGLDVPVMMIGLGAGADRLAATDTSASGSNFEALFPAAKVEQIVPANHFSALGLCKPDGAAILESEKDDPVCTDPAGTDRKAVLDKIITLVARHFKLG